MKIGRNDSCPCGSGKKYKKCCLEKDEALARERARQNLWAESDEDLDQGEEFDEPDFHKYAEDGQDDFANVSADDGELDDEDDELEDEPGDESQEQTGALNARWKEFEAADGEDQIGLLLKTIEEPELMDDQLAFDMLDVIRAKTLQRGDRDRYDALIEKLRDRLPEVYAESAHFYLQNMIANAAAAGRWDKVRALALELAGRASEDLDIFDNVAAQLIYHGQLATLLDIADRAWPEIKGSGDILPWGMDEFASKAANFVVFDYLERSTAPRADDPELQQRLAFFTAIEPERFTEFFNIISGQITRSWTMKDFDFKTHVHITQNEKGKRRRQHISPGKRNLGDLGFEFLRRLHQHENVSYTKAEMARENIAEYLIKRYDGNLEERESMLERMMRGNRPKPQIKRRPPEHILCPDAATLERYFVKQLHFLNPQYYEVAATYELLPAWLRFLESRQLIDAGQRQRTLHEIGKLHKDLLTLFEKYRSDPALAEALRRWNEEARS